MIINELKQGEQSDVIRSKGIKSFKKGMVKNTIYHREIK